MQTLYAFSQNEQADIQEYEKKLLQSIEKFYELFIWQLSFIIAVVDFERKRLEEAKNKFLPTEEDLNPNTKFIDNIIITKIAANKEFLNKENKLHISWKDNEDLIRHILSSIKENKHYIKYMSTKNDNDFDTDKTFLRKLFTDIFAPSQLLMQFYEEKNIYWADDYDNVALAVIKTIKEIKSEATPDDPLPLTSKKTNEDLKEDIDFAIELFRKTIIYSKDFIKLIDMHIENWEVERIALTDNILCRMALTEFTQFPSIPIKVTLNEYIEISKAYSTPKSSIFINGVLDKLANALKNEGKINKQGRGLVDE